MPGRVSGGAARSVCLLLFLALTGCKENAAQITSSGPARRAKPASRYCPESAGKITGQVVWQGGKPKAPHFAVPTTSLFLPHWKAPEKFFPNPHAPQIHPESRGIQNAVVFLEKVDPQVSRPWDHPPVTIAFRDYLLEVRQGGEVSPIGFVRTGDRVKLLADETRRHIIRAAGASYFTLTLPAPKQPRSRRLKRAGVVELSSASGYFWLRSWLFVADHSYYARTNDTGKFTLERVPPGNYRLIAWLPNWIVDSYDRDPEMRVISRLNYRSPVSQEKEMQVRPSAETKVNFAFSSNLFGETIQNHQPKCFFPTVPRRSISYQMEADGDNLEKKNCN